MSVSTHLIYAGSAVLIAGMAVAGYVYTSTSAAQFAAVQIQPPQAVPAAVQAQSHSQPWDVYSQIQTPPNVAPLDQQAAQGQFAAQAQQQFAPQPVVAPVNLGDDPKVVASLTNVLSRAHYIEGKTKPKDGRWTYILFDPNCPYCHAAYEELDSKIAIRWLPVPLLGDTPIETATTLLAKPDSKTLDDAFNKKLSNDPAANNTQNQTKAYENLQLMQSFVSSGQAQGVPVILAPRANGTAHYQSGYNAGESAPILTAIGG